MKITKCWTSWHLSQFLEVLMSLFNEVIIAFCLSFTSNILSFRFWNVNLWLICRGCESLIHSWHTGCFIQFVFMFLSFSSFCYCNLFFLSLFCCYDLWFHMLDCVLASKPLIQKPIRSFSLSHIIKHSLLNFIFFDFFILTSMVWFVWMSKLLNLNRFLKELILRIILTCWISYI